MTFKLTQRQQEAQTLLASPAMFGMLFGGSRSGKTFLHVRNIVLRALKAPGSRHAILRFRFNHVKQSIIYDTFPKVMSIAFPGVEYHLNKTDWFVTINPGTDQAAEIWFGGLDDKERTEKILGNEYVTIYLNECSQISWASVGIVITRLAQKVMQQIRNATGDLVTTGEMVPRFWFDCNPPSKLHWTYKLFIKLVDPDSGKPLPDPENYVQCQMNPESNRENLSAAYLKTLENLPPHLRKRFLAGEFADANPDQLFRAEVIDTWRHSGALPDMVRIAVGVDPSGSEDDADNGSHDAIGIAVVGVGTDGNAYLLEDCTINAGPSVWGGVATSAFDRHQADIIVGELNFGGGMVEFVIQTHRPRTPFKKVVASRGKVVRAEPFSVLYEQGKIRHAGNFPELEEELSGFSTFGFLGDKSPNRADALFWALAELFPSIVRTEKKPKAQVLPTANRWNK